MQAVLTKILWKKQRLVLRLRGFLVCFFIRFLGGKCGGGLLVDRGLHFKYPPHKGVRIGNKCSFGRNITIDVPPGGQLSIGDRCSFTMNVVLAAIEHVKIGEDTQVAEFTSIRDADHGMRPGLLMKTQPQSGAPICIGKDVWLARGVAVLKGAQIGDGAVIAANAVVKGRIAANSIAVGAPAKVVRSRCDYPR